MTINVELSEEHYWILAQAVSAAGTASHRHGMEKHAERFHEAEKNLFRAYEQSDNHDDAEIDVIMHRPYRGEMIHTELEISTTAQLGQLLNQMKETYPDAEFTIR